MSKEFKNGNNEINQSGEHNSISRNNIKQNQCHPYWVAYFLFI